MNGEIKISLKIEEISKLICLNTKCENNLYASEGFYCNLKVMEINENGECDFYKRKVIK